MPRTFRILRASDWKHVEKLFGPRGACGDCWCMHWRRKRGENTPAVRAKNKSDFKALLESGKVHAALAFEDGECVGWCNFGPKTDFDKLCRSPKLGTSDNDAVWSIPCFFIKNSFRKKGLGSALLFFTLERMQRMKRVRTIEAYPVQSGGKTQAAAFIYTGVLSMFEKLGFRPHPQTRGSKGMNLYRKELSLPSLR